MKTNIWYKKLKLRGNYVYSCNPIKAFSNLQDWNFFTYLQLLSKLNFRNHRKFGPD